MLKRRNFREPKSNPNKHKVSVTSVLSIQNKISEEEEETLVISDAQFTIHLFRTREELEKKGETLGEEAINGFVRIHVTVLEHGIDLGFRAVNNFL